MTVHRTPPERWLEQRLSARRHQEHTERQRAARRKGQRPQYGPGPRRRALVGEVIEDLVVEVARVVRSRR